MKFSRLKMISILRTLLSISFSCGYLILVGPIAILINYITGKEDVLFKGGRLVIKIGLGIAGVQVTSEGFKDRSEYKSCLFIANHQSNLDPAVLSLISPVNLKFLPKKQIFYIPILSTVLKRAGFFSVDREKKINAVEFLSGVIDKLKQGNCYCIFPEGTRTSTGKLQQFKRGAFLLAVRSHCNVVPVLIKGSYALMPKGQWYISSGTIEVKICSPIDTGKYKAEDIAALQDKIFQILNKDIKEA